MSMQLAIEHIIAAAYLFPVLILAGLFVLLGAKLMTDIVMLIIDSSRSRRERVSIASMKSAMVIILFLMFAMSLSLVCRFA